MQLMNASKIFSDTVTDFDPAPALVMQATVTRYRAGFLFVPPIKLKAFIYCTTTCAQCVLAASACMLELLHDVLQVS
jgi:hypothetical protein